MVVYSLSIDPFYGLENLQGLFRRQEWRLWTVFVTGVQTEFENKREMTRTCCARVAVGSLCTISIFLLCVAGKNAYLLGVGLENVLNNVSSNIMHLFFSCLPKSL